MVTKCSNAEEYSEPFDKSDVESRFKLRINLKLPRQITNTTFRTLTTKVALNSPFYRSNIVEQDWTQNVKRGSGGGAGGTFILDDSDMSASMTTPASIRLKSGSVSSGSRPVSRSKIPSAMSSHRKSGGMESSFTNGSLMNTSMTTSMMSSSEDVLLAVRQVEDSISPLARANNQIRDSLSQLEKSLLILKAATIAETPNSD